MQSKQPGAQHAQNCGDDRGLQEKPPSSPPTHYHEQHCECSGVIQIPGNHHLSGPEVGHSHRLHREKGPAENVLSSSTEKVNLPQVHMTQFYSAVIESVLCSSITVWFGSASKSDIRRLQRTVRTAERIIGVHLPSLQDLYYSRVKKRAGNIITDPSHPGHDLFALLLQADATDLCALEKHKTVFSPMPSPA